MADQVEIGILLKAVDEASATLNAAGESIKALGTAATDAAGQSTDMGDAIDSAMKEIGPSCDLATHAIVENGREIRNATRDYKLANIEHVQTNQLLQQMGSTAIDWGSAMQGSHNKVNQAARDLADTMSKATNGLTDYFGAAVQILGQGINFYSQIDRLAFVYSLHATAVAGDTFALDANASSAGLAAIAQGALNAVMDINPVVLMGAAVGAIAVAAGSVILAYDNWQDHTKTLDEEIVALIDNLDQAKTKMYNLYHGDTIDTAELKVKLDDLRQQYQDLGIKAEAARELGMLDTMSGLEDQRARLADEITLSEKELELRKKRPPTVAEELANQADVYQKAVDAFIKTADARGKYWEGGGMDTPAFFDYASAEKDAKEYGEKYVDAWAEGCKKGAYSAANQAIMDEAAEKLGEDFRAESPPKKGPLKDIEIWGRDLARSYGKGIVSGVPEMLDSTSRLSASIAGNIPKGGASGSSPGDFGLGGVSSPGFSVIMNNYHVDEDRIVRKLMAAMQGSLV